MPNKINFPTREERKQLLKELRELEQTQGKEFASSELYQKYAEALNVLDQKMDELCTLGSMGLPPEVNAEEKDQLLTLLANVGKAGETFLGDAQEKGEDLTAGIFRTVGRMQGMLAKDFQTISRYDPRNPTYLSVLQEHSRTKTIDLKGQNIKTMGNMQSSRIPMTFRGANGETRTGVFTKASYVKIKAPFLEEINKAKAQCGTEGAAELDKFLTKAREYHISKKSRKYDEKSLKDTSDDFMVGYVLNVLRGNRKQSGSKTLKASHVKEYMQKVGLNVNAISKDAFNTLAKGLGKMADTPGYAINGYGLELKDNQRLDNRNSAMSAVADLLGAGFLLAKSTNMRFVDEKGKVTEGTFMDYGKGLDLCEDQNSVIHLNNHPLENPKTYNQALRSIADLQILDALCLNVDRHQGNVMYRVDKQGNFIGVQGIDNDSSFGPRGLSLEEIKDMRVISKSMADKLQALTPEMLKFTLRGRGLNEEEIRAAADRLNALKDSVDMGLLKTVPDDQFSQLALDDLIPKNGDNMFYRALRQVNESAQQRIQMNQPFVPLGSENPPHLTDVATTGRKHIVGGLTDLQDKVSLLLRNDKTGFKVEDLSGIRGTSAEFKDMVEAARMVDHAGTFLRQNDPETKGRSFLMLDDPKAQKTVKVYNNVFMNLREKSTEYLGKKMQERHAASLDELRGKNPYEQARIDYAKKLLDVTDEYLEIRDKPLTEEERTERNRLMEFRGLVNRDEFKRNFEKGEAPAVDAEAFPKEPAQNAEKKEPEIQQVPVLQ